jgi:hypothetical protein
VWLGSVYLFPKDPCPSIGFAMFAFGCWLGANYKEDMLTRYGKHRTCDRCGTIRTGFFLSRLNAALLCLDCAWEVCEAPSYGTIMRPDRKGAFPTTEDRRYVEHRRQARSTRERSWMDEM